MGLKGKLGKLQKAMRGNLESFELRDGSRYYFDPEEAFVTTFRFFTDCMDATWKREPYPDPPQLLKMVVDAKDREEALSRVMNGGSHLPLDRSALVERGELLPRSLIAGRTYEEWMAEG